MSDSPPAVGSIRLFDAATPDFQAGLYRFTSALDVERRTPGGTISPLQAPPVQSTHVEVTGPRFALDGAGIAGRHPPADTIGAFGDRLPHVALGRRTLPWERRAHAAQDGMPWLALLVFTKDEAQLATGTVQGLLPASVVATLQALDPFAGDPAIAVVHAKDLATLRGVLPSRSDVRLLAHVRQVNIADSALAGRDDDGIFSVVTANRLPLATGADGTPYLACLVSLEGRDDVWTVPDGQPPPQLVVLYSWTFTCTSEGGTFEYLANSLDVGLLGKTAPGVPGLLAAGGTIPVERVDRSGAAGSARYRGPLLGTATGQSLGIGADEASAPAAYELGRLLGAADGRFLRELVAWHRAADGAARTDIVARSLAEVLAAGGQLGRRAPAGLGRAERITTTEVKGALADVLGGIARAPANLWQVHPAGLSTLKAKGPRKARHAARGRRKGGER